MTSNKKGRWRRGAWGRGSTFVTLGIRLLVKKAMGGVKKVKNFMMSFMNYPFTKVDSQF